MEIRSSVKARQAGSILISGTAGIAPINFSITGQFPYIADATINGKVLFGGIDQSDKLAPRTTPRSPRARVTSTVRSTPTFGTAGITTPATIPNPIFAPVMVVRNNIAYFIGTTFTASPQLALVAMRI